jgi:hypothetical protein
MRPVASSVGTMTTIECWASCPYTDALHAGGYSDDGSTPKFSKSRQELHSLKTLAPNRCVAPSVFISAWMKSAFPCSSTFK